MKRYFEIAKINFHKNLSPHIGIAMAFIILVPFLMGVVNLDSSRTAQVLEVYIALLGIIILVPMFLPEQNKNIKDLVETKQTAMLEVHIIRIIEAALCLSICIAGFLIYLKFGNCIFPFTKFFCGTMAEAIFLGAMGIVIYAIFDNIATAYMFPLVYYIINFGSGRKILGNFYLFSMGQGSFVEKYYLFITGIVLIIIGILIRHYKLETRIYSGY